MKRLSICLSAVFLLPVSASAEVINLGTGTTVITEVSREGRITGSYYSHGKVQTKDIVRKRQKPVFVGSVTVEPVEKVVKKAAVKPVSKAVITHSQPAPAMTKPAQNNMPKVVPIDDMPMQATDSDMRQPAMPAPASHAPRGSHEEGNLPSVPASAQDMEREMHR